MNLSPIDPHDHNHETVQAFIYGCLFTSVVWWAAMLVLK